MSSDTQIGHGGFLHLFDAGNVTLYQLFGEVLSGSALMRGLLASLGCKVLAIHLSHGSCINRNGTFGRCIVSERSGARS